MKTTSSIDNDPSMGKQVYRKPIWSVAVGGCCLLLVVAAVNLALITPRSSSAQEREGGRSAEGDRGRRESAEGKVQRRSPESDAGRRRSPEADAPPRRSPEAEAGRRRSPEADLRRGRSPEADAPRRRAPERDFDRRPAEGNALRGFKPQTEREAALFRMIVQLQREVAELRRAVQSSRGRSERDPVNADRPRRDGDAPRDAARRSDGPADLDPGWERTKTGRVFLAYDKNGDKFVGLEEWLAMTNGNISDARRKLQTERFAETNPGRDNKLSPSEFIYWYTKGRFADRRERPRATESDRRRPTDDVPSRREGESERSPRRSPERDR